MEVKVESLDSGFLFTRVTAHEQTRHAFESWVEAWQWIDDNMPYYEHFKVIIEELKEEEDETR